MSDVKIFECPRDAWQGLEKNIPTARKVEYLLALVNAGFTHIDAVSFVSPKVAQMADSEEVMKQFLASLPAEKPAPEENDRDCCEHEARHRARARRHSGAFTTLGYPYSISAYFRRANANMSRAESRALVEHLRKVTKEANRDHVIYISMAFGNPYDEPWGPELVEDTLFWLKDIGVKSVSLADTAGTANAEQVGALYRAVKGCVAGIELGVHLHSRPEDAAAKVARCLRGRIVQAIRRRAHRTWRVSIRWRRSRR